MQQQLQLVNQSGARLWFQLKGFVVFGAAQQPGPSGWIEDGQVWENAVPGATGWTISAARAQNGQPFASGTIVAPTPGAVIGASSIKPLSIIAAIYTHETPAMQHATAARSQIAQSALGGLQAAMTGEAQPVAPAAGDPSWLGNLLVSSFSRKEPPREEPPDIDPQTLQQLDGNSTHAAATIISTASWFQHEAINMVDPILKARAQSEKQREALAYITGAPAVGFQNQLGIREAVNSDFNAAVEALAHDDSMRLNALPEFVAGVSLGVTFTRISDALSDQPDSASPMRDQVQEAIQALQTSKTQYKNTLETLVDQAGVRGTPLEDSFRKGVATHYLAEADATPETFFDPAVKTFQLVLQKLQSTPSSTPPRAQAPAGQQSGGSSS